MRVYLTLVRQGLPDAPMCVVSPIVRPAAETAPNRLGATLGDLRRALEGAVEQFAAAHGDRRLWLIPGAELLSADALVDGVHPGDEGHALMADALISDVAFMVGRSATV
jgi:lysophospholipase L1-like esterase